jgi:hypothetical protein
MPPNRFSRHRFTTANVIDSRLVLDARMPFGFQVLDDTRLHTVVEGDTLHTLAGQYFPNIPRGCGLWWVIADFQPNPIIDPTIALVAGSQLAIPSERTVNDLILNEARRRLET